MSDANIQIVQQFYEKFGSGDIPGLIDLLSEDITWDHRGPELDTGENRSSHRVTSACAIWGFSTVSMGENTQPEKQISGVFNALRFNRGIFAHPPKS